MFAKTTIRLSIIALVCVVGSASGQAKSEVEVPFYGNAVCPISNKAIERERYVDHEGQRIYTCCKRCVKAVKAAPAVNLAKAYPKVIKTLAGTRCSKATSKPGKTLSSTFQGYKVTHCCAGCKKAFDAQPRKGLALLTHKGLKDLGNKQCPVMPDEAAAADIFAIYNNQIINLCCEDCTVKLKKSPEKYLKAMKASKKDK